MKKNNVYYFPLIQPVESPQLRNIIHNQRKKCYVMGLFDFLSKPSWYSTWKMQMGYAVGQIKNHVNMLEALEELKRHAECYGYFTTNLI